MNKKNRKNSNAYTVRHYHTNHIREEGGGMFIEADDALPQLVSPHTIREDPQLLLQLLP